MTEELLEIIAKNPGITYTDLIYKTKESSSGLWLMLMRMQKEGKIKTVVLPDRKAKGFVRVRV
jgi:hypothetical protein